MWRLSRFLRKDLVEVTSNKLLTERRKTLLNLRKDDPNYLKKEATAAIWDSKRELGLKEYDGTPIDRYLPNLDPNAFLVESHKLTREEARFQVLFAIAPWVAFAICLALPPTIIKFNLEKAHEIAHRNMVAESKNVIESNTSPPFTNVSSLSIMDLTERRHPTLLLTFSSQSFNAAPLLAMLVSLDKVLQKHGVRASIAAFDLNQVGTSLQLKQQIPPALSPTLSLVIPQALRGGEAGLQEVGLCPAATGGMMGSKSVPMHLRARAVNIIRELRDVGEVNIGAANNSEFWSDIKKIDEDMDRFAEEMFNLTFVLPVMEKILKNQVRTMKKANSVEKNTRSWWSWLGLGSSSSKNTDKETTDRAFSLSDYHVSHNISSVSEEGLKVILQKGLESINDMKNYVHVI